MTNEASNELMIDNNLINDNPHAARDIDTLKEALKAIRNLRDMGYKSKSYDLASPFERRRAQESKKIIINSN